jgi:hypothetical protein
MHVSLDDGTSEGRPAAQDGETYEPTIETPTFDPLALGVDWKVLPAGLMYGILNLPYSIEQLDNHIAGSWEYDDPPKFTEFSGRGALVMPNSASHFGPCQAAPQTRRIAN